MVPDSPLHVAAFDLDHTLTDCSTLPRFLARLVGRPGLAHSVVAGLVAAGLPPSRARLKASIIESAVTGLDRPAVCDVAEQFAADMVRDHLHPAMRNLVADHRRRGHRVVIVSAALDVYVAPVASRLDVNDVIATRVEFDAAGRCTGRVMDADLWGEKKVTLLLQHLAVRPTPASLCLWAYGDSKSDEALQALARSTRSRTRLA